MFGLKIFVRVRTFRRAPPVQLLPPCVVWKLQLHMISIMWSCINWVTCIGCKFDVQVEPPELFPLPIIVLWYHLTFDLYQNIFVHAGLEKWGNPLPPTSGIYYDTNEQEPVRREKRYQWSNDRIILFEFSANQNLLCLHQGKKRQFSDDDQNVRGIICQF